MPRRLSLDRKTEFLTAKNAPSTTVNTSSPVPTEVGEVEIEVPCDRDGSFDPQIVKKRQRRLTGVDELVISLAANGLTTGEIAAHLQDVYGAEVSRDTISRITDAILEEIRGTNCSFFGCIHPPRRA